MAALLRLYTLCLRITHGEGVNQFYQVSFSMGEVEWLTVGCVALLLSIIIIIICPVPAARVVLFTLLGGAVTYTHKDRDGWMCAERDGGGRSEVAQWVDAVCQRVMLCRIRVLCHIALLFRLLFRLRQLSRANRHWI